MVNERRSRDARGEHLERLLLPRTHVIQMQLAKYIESTNVEPNATREDIERLCDEAVKYGFYAVCVLPTWVPLAVKRLKGTGVKVVTGPIAFFGGTPEMKAFGARHVVEMGADAVDMLINLGALKSGDLDLAKRDMAAVVEAAKGVNPSVEVKVIIECCYLSDEEKVTAARLAEETGIDLVKTSTGRGPWGAKVEDVRLLRSVLSPRVKVKAAGGIRTREQALAMIEAGAERIGTSTAVEIVKS